jgi:hypothetical protein
VKKYKNTNKLEDNKNEQKTILVVVRLTKASFQKGGRNSICWLIV